MVYGILCLFCCSVACDRLSLFLTKADAVVNLPTIHPAKASPLTAMVILPANPSPATPIDWSIATVPPATIPSPATTVASAGIIAAAVLPATTMPSVPNPKLVTPPMTTNGAANDRVKEQLLWKIVSKETTFKGGEHHTRGTGTDNDDRVLAIAMARGLCRTEKGR